MDRCQTWIELKILATGYNSAKLKYVNTNKITELAIDLNVDRVI